MALSTTVLAAVAVFLLLAILTALPDESRPALARSPAWLLNCRLGPAASACGWAASAAGSAAAHAAGGCSVRRFGKCLVYAVAGVAACAALGAGLSRVGQGGLVPHDARDMSYENGATDIGLHNPFQVSTDLSGGGGARRPVPGEQKRDAARRSCLLRSVRQIAAPPPQLSFCFS
jgi:hypothetical protein